MHTFILFRPTGTRLSLMRLFRQFKSNAPLIPFVGLSDQFKVKKDRFTSKHNLQKDWMPIQRVTFS